MLGDLHESFDVFKFRLGLFGLADIEPLHAHALHRHFPVALHANDLSGLFALHVFDEEVGDAGAAILVIRELRPFVENVGIDRDNRIERRFRFDAAHDHVVDETAAAAVGLDVVDAVDFIGGAVFHENIANAAGYLAPHAENRMRMDDFAVADDDVLRRTVQTPGVAVAARLDDDAVVALIETAVLDEHVARHFDVDAVVVVAVGVDIKPAHDDVLAVVEMDRPERRIAHLEILEPDVFAAVDLQKVGPRVGVWLLVDAALFNRIILRAPVVKLAAGGADAVVLRHPLLPERVLEFSLVAAQHALAGDGDIGA